MVLKGEMSGGLYRLVRNVRVEGQGELLQVTKAEGM